jgi:hypothetical protein
LSRWRRSCGRWWRGGGWKRRSGPELLANLAVVDALILLPPVPDRHSQPRRQDEHSCRGENYRDIPAVKHNGASQRPHDLPPEPALGSGAGSTPGTRLYLPLICSTAFCCSHDLNRSSTLGPREAGPPGRDRACHGTWVRVLERHPEGVQGLTGCVRLDIAAGEGARGPC